MRGMRCFAAFFQKAYFCSERDKSLYQKSLQHTAHSSQPIQGISVRPTHLTLHNRGLTQTSHKTCFHDHENPLKSAQIRSPRYEGCVKIYLQFLAIFLK